MGSWGPALYSDDTAAALRDALKEIVRIPKGGPELLELVLAQWPPGDEDDDDHSIVWLVTADQFHRYGIDCPALMARARAIVEDGLDDRLMARLEMTAADRATRRTALARLAAGWSRPHPKPARRKVLTSPPRNPFAAGDVWAYPTRGGNPPNTLDPLAFIERTFRPDGWSAFVVGTTATRLGIDPIAFVVRLHVDRAERPDLAACLEASVGGRISEFHGDDAPRATVGWVRASTSVVKKLRAERIGSVDVDWDAVTRALPLSELDPRHPPLAIHNVLHVTIAGMSMGDAESLAGERAAPYGVWCSDLIRRQ